MIVARRLGRNLARIRRLADLSQDELAIRASLHRTEVSQIERGIRVPRVSTLIRLAASLESSVEELVKGIVWQPGETRHGGFSERGDG